MTQLLNYFKKNKFYSPIIFDILTIGKFTSAILFIALILVLEIASYSLLFFAFAWIIAYLLSSKYKAADIFINFIHKLTRLIVVLTFFVLYLFFWGVIADEIFLFIGFAILTFLISFFILSIREKLEVEAINRKITLFLTISPLFLLIFCQIFNIIGSIKLNETINKAKNLNCPVTLDRKSVV